MKFGICIFLCSLHLFSSEQKLAQLNLYTFDSRTYILAETLRQLSDIITIRRIDDELKMRRILRKYVRRRRQQALKVSQVALPVASDSALTKMSKRPDALSKELIFDVPDDIREIEEVLIYNAQGRPIFKGSDIHGAYTFAPRLLTEQILPENNFFIDIHYVLLSCLRIAPNNLEIPINIYGPDGLCKEARIVIFRIDRELNYWKGTSHSFIERDRHAAFKKIDISQAIHVRHKK
ncbi:hypothetical protein A3J41_00450 [candidate division TM6 bacterium RIFCSPHIGHO2_12_FULL_38_8]|nr:MAG: hypothetical protein A3J41_00450 [candidate division TM6 bacterium RIFCSPHIGHO2_12_FULL_38_8]